MIPLSFSLPQIDIDSFLQRVSLPCLNVQQCADLSRLFMTTEIQEVIDSMPINKSPGVDEFPTEYYKRFKTFLTTHLVELFTSILREGTIPKEML